MQKFENDASKENAILLEPITTSLTTSVARINLVAPAIASYNNVKIQTDKYVESIIPNLIKIEESLKLIEQNNIDLSVDSNYLRWELSLLVEKLENLDNRIWSDYKIFVPSLDPKHYGENQKPMGSLSSEIEEVFGNTDSHDWYRQNGALNR